MRQPQKNLFFSYRGATRVDDESEAALDRQLEDNVTRALVYVLEHADRATVLEPFLKTVVKVRTAIPPDDVQFALQRVDIRRPSVRERVALSIAPIGQVVSAPSSTTQSGRPDAWIWADEAFAVLVETKIRGAATREQIQRHIEGARGWPTPRVTFSERSWGEVYGFFLGVCASSTKLDSTTRLLVQEFTRYLRMIGLVSESVFDVDDFSYFVLRPEDREATSRALLKRKLTRFARELGESPSLRPVLRHHGSSSAADLVNPGAFARDGDEYWITIGPKLARNKCHFTVRLTEEGIALEVFSPHKAFTERFVKKISASPREFIKALQPFAKSAEYRIRLREAYYADSTSAYKGQRIKGKVDYLVVQPALLTEQNISQLIINPTRERLKRKEFRPEIFLVRQFPLSEIVGRNDVVERVAKAAEPMLPYLKFALEL